MSVHTSIPVLPEDTETLAGVLSWALPFLDVDAPAFGSSAWLALPDDDPRRAAAVVHAALAAWQAGAPDDLTAETEFRGAVAADVKARGAGPSHEVLAARRTHGPVEWCGWRKRYVPAG